MDEPKLSRMGLVAWELGSAITAAVLSFVVTLLMLIFVPKPGWLVGPLLVLSGIPLVIQSLVGAPIIGYALARRYRRRFRWGPLLFGLMLAPVGWFCAYWWTALISVWERTLRQHSSVATEFYVYGTVGHLALVGLFWCTCVLLAELRPRR